MTDTVRIMPRQPIEAKANSNGSGEAWYSPGYPYMYYTFPQTEWHEVSDPIVWDDDPKTLQTIADALPEQYDLYHDQCFGRAVIVAFEDPEKRTISELPYLNRIQIVGDSFVILPPEMES